MKPQEPTANPAAKGKSKPSTQNKPRKGPDVKAPKVPQGSALQIKLDTLPYGSQIIQFKEEDFRQYDNVSTVYLGRFHEDDSANDNPESYLPYFHQSVGVAFLSKLRRAVSGRRTYDIGQLWEYLHRVANRNLVAQNILEWYAYEQAPLSGEKTICTPFWNDISKATDWSDAVFVATEWMHLQKNFPLPPRMQEFIRQAAKGCVFGPSDKVLLPNYIDTDPGSIDQAGELFSVDDLMNYFKIPTPTESTMQLAADIAAIGAIPATFSPGLRTGPQAVDILANMRWCRPDASWDQWLFMLHANSLCDQETAFAAFASWNRAETDKYRRTALADWDIESETWEYSDWTNATTMSSPGNAINAMNLRDFQVWMSEGEPRARYLVGTGNIWCLRKTEGDSVRRAISRWMLGL